MRDKKVLIDTSVWLAYFKDKNDEFAQKVDQILTFSDVHVPRVVIAELIQGAKSEKEISIIEELLDAFTLIDQREDTWVEAGKLSFSMKRKGITVNLVDCYIAIIAKEFGCAILTFDVHFKSIARFLSIELLDV